MPSKGLTVTPDYDADGNYSGSTVSTHPNDYATDNSGRVVNWEQDYYQDSYGETQHRFSGVELQSERQGPTDFDMEAYKDALVAEHPELDQALQWAADSPHFTQEEIDAYNYALDNEDLEAINEFYERLLPLFAEENQFVETEAEEEESFDDDSDEAYYEQLDESGVIDSTIDDLMDEGYSIDEDGVYQLETVTETFEEGTAEHAIAQAGLMVTAGELTMEDAIAYVTEAFGDAKAAKAFFQLQEILN